MTDRPDERIILETPHDWVRQGEERARREWAASHPAYPIYSPDPPRPARAGRRWVSAVLCAFLLTMALCSLAVLPLASQVRSSRSASQIGHSPSARRATIGNPTPGPTTSLTTTTATANLTGCTSASVSGTLTNTGDRTRTFVIGVYVAPGTAAPWRWKAAPPPQLRAIAPGETVAWSTSSPVARAGAVTCSLSSVLP